MFFGLKPKNVKKNQQNRSNRFDSLVAPQKLKFYKQCCVFKLFDASIAQRRLTNPEMLSEGGRPQKEGGNPQNRRKIDYNHTFSASKAPKIWGKIPPFLAQKVTFLDENDNSCENFSPSYSFDEVLTAWLK